MLNRSNIEEANKHLHALNGRVEDLERVVREQHEALLAKDSFIHTKVMELTHQDLVIRKLRQQLEEQETELAEKNSLLDSLEKVLNARQLENKVLIQRNKSLSKLLHIIPELNAVIVKMESVAKTVEGDCYGYVEEETSSHSDTNVSADADNTDSNMLMRVDTGIASEYVADVKHEQTVAEMARHFVRTGKSRQFSVSEDDQFDQDSGDGSLISDSKFITDRHFTGDTKFIDSGKKANDKEVYL